MKENKENRISKAKDEESFKKGSGQRIKCYRKIKRIQKMFFVPGDYFLSYTGKNPLLDCSPFGKDQIDLLHIKIISQFKMMD